MFYPHRDEPTGGRSPPRVYRHAALSDKRARSPSHDDNGKRQRVAPPALVYPDASTALPYTYDSPYPDTAQYQFSTFDPTVYVHPVEQQYHIPPPPPQLPPINLAPLPDVDVHGILSNILARHTYLVAHLQLDSYRPGPLEAVPPSACRALLAHLGEQDYEVRDSIDIAVRARLEQQQMQQWTKVEHTPVMMTPSNEGVGGRRHAPPLHLAPSSLPAQMKPPAPARSLSAFMEARQSLPSPTVGCFPTSARGPAPPPTPQMSAPEPDLHLPAPITRSRPQQGTLRGPAPPSPKKPSQDRKNPFNADIQSIKTLLQNCPGKSKTFLFEFDKLVDSLVQSITRHSPPSHKVLAVQSLIQIGHLALQPPHGDQLKDVGGGTRGIYRVIYGVTDVLALMDLPAQAGMLDAVRKFRDEELEKYCFGVFLMRTVAQLERGETVTRFRDHGMVRAKVEA